MSMKKASTKEFKVFVRRCFLIIISAITVTTVAAQNPPRLPTANEEKLLEAAEKLYDEAEALFDKETEKSYRAAAEKFQAAAELFAQAGDLQNQAFSWLMTGVSASSLNDNNRALKNFNAALSLFRSLNYREQEANTLILIGEAYDRLDDKQKALEFYAESLLLFRAVENKDGVLTALASVSSAYYHLDNYRKSLSYSNELLELSRAYGNKRREVTALINIGEIYSHLGEKQKALDYHNQALPLSREAGSNSQESTIINNIGNIYNFLGEKPKALEYFNKALSLSRTAGNKSGEATTLINAGRVYDDLGETQIALNYFQQALRIVRDLGSKSREATALTSIGGVYSALGERQTALEYFNQSLPISRAIGDKSQESTVLNNIGGVYLDLGNREKALEYFNESLLLSRTISDEAAVMTILSNIGIAYSRTGEKQKALDYYSQSLSLSRKAGYKTQEATTLNNIGRVYDDLNQPRKALDYYNQSLPISRAAGDKLMEAIILSNLTIIWDQLENKKLAAFYGKQTVNIRQQLRLNAKSLDRNTQQTFLKSIEAVYRHLTEILIADNRFAEAHQILDLFKDQQFFDFIQNPDKRIKAADQTPRETAFALRYRQKSEELGQIGVQLDTLKRSIGSSQPSSAETVKLRELETKLTTVSNAFLAVLKQAESEFSNLSDEKDKIGSVSNTRDVQTALRSLHRLTGQKTVAVYTMLGKADFHALIISPDDIKAVSHKIEETELNEKARQLWGLLQSDKYDTTVLSKQIYDAIFSPVEKALPADTKTIMWNLDGNLRYLPMAVLWDGKQFLAERFNHVYFTRNDTERMIRDVTANSTGNGFGSSKAQTVEILNEKRSFAALPGVDEELKEIFGQSNSKTGILTGKVLANAEFTKKSFLELLKERRAVVHIASHFSFRPGDEMRSFLLLGDGSVFNLEEMKRQEKLFDGVELLTLSACNTAAQQAGGDGREIDAFFELAQRLGASSVLATLWSVTDSSTPQLMKEFYWNRKNKRLTKADALREAQMALLRGELEAEPTFSRTNLSPVKVVIAKSPKDKERKDEKTRGDVIYLDEQIAQPFVRDRTKPFAHPYYWSPFILFGNWR